MGQLDGGSLNYGANELCYHWTIELWVDHAVITTQLLDHAIIGTLDNGLIGRWGHWIMPLLDYEDIRALGN